MAHGTRHRVQSRVFRVGRWVVIIGFLIATLVPFYYMLLLSVKPIGSLLQNPASFWVRPSEFTLQTYVDVLSPVASGGQGFGRFLVNSGVVALASVALALLIGIPGAYAIARFPFIGRRYVSGIFLGAYLFPAILMAIPLFVGFTRLPGGQCPYRLDHRGRRRSGGKPAEDHGGLGSEVRRHGQAGCYCGGPADDHAHIGGSCKRPTRCYCRALPQRHEPAAHR